MIEIRCAKCGEPQGAIGLKLKSGRLLCAGCAEYKPTSIQAIAAAELILQVAEQPRKR